MRSLGVTGPHWMPCCTRTSKAKLRKVFRLIWAGPIPVPRICVANFGDRSRNTSMLAQSRRAFMRSMMGD